MRLCRTLLALLLLAAAAPALRAAETLKIATLAPDGTAWMKAMRAAGEEVRKRTAGRVELRFYPGGVMGNDATVLRKMQIGQLQGGMVTMLALYQAYPDSQLYGLPLLFRSYAEADYVRARMDGPLLEGFERTALVAVGLVEGGFAYLLSSAPIRRIADLRAEKVWAPEGDRITPMLFRAAGVAPVVLPLADVYTGLQTGLVTAVGNSASGAIALQWHSKTKYLTDVPLFYTMGALVLDRRAYERIPAADREPAREVLAQALRELDKASRRDEEAARAALRNHGIEFVRPAPADIDEFESAAARARAEIVKAGLYSSPLLHTLEGHLKTFRAKGDAAPGR
jgi:TRAP-type C4-dicarboxylate transport system substrate-binding protein